MVFGLAAVFIIFINMASASPQGNSTPYVKELILGFMALLMVGLLFGKFDRIPYSVMKIYKFGNIEASELVLEKGACELLKTLGVDVLVTNYDICIVEDVLILSRLGRESYLKIDQDESTSLKFTIESSSVVSWTLRENKKDKK